MLLLQCVCLLVCWDSASELFYIIFCGVEVFVVYSLGIRGSVYFISTLADKKVFGVIGWP